VIRRFVLLDLLVGGVWVLGGVGSALVNRAQGIGVVMACLVLAAAGLSYVYLAAIAGWVRVTPAHVVINNPFARYLVPRRLVEGLSVEAKWAPRLHASGGRTIRIVALDRNQHPFGVHVLGTNQRKARRMRNMLAETPGEEGQDEIVRQWRTGNLIVGALMTLGVLAPSLYLLAL
jgi:hypothetical protein